MTTPALDALLRSGCTLFGRPVVRLAVRLADGRRAVFDLPTPGGAADPDRLGETERKILDVLRAAAVPLKRLAVARRMGRESATGSFGVAFRGLIARGLVRRDGAGYVEVPARPVAVSAVPDPAGLLPGM